MLLTSAHSSHSADTYGPQTSGIPPVRQFWEHFCFAMGMMCISVLLLSTRATTRKPPLRRQQPLLLRLSLVFAASSRSA